MKKLRQVLSDMLYVLLGLDVILNFTEPHSLDTVSLGGHAAFSFDRFSILGPGQWQDSTEMGQAKNTN